MRTIYTLVVAALIAIGCEKKSSTNTGTAPKESGNMKLTSTAFAANAAIPAKHAHNTQNVSPPLSWTNAPAGAQELALIMDDPDAPGGTFTHWVLYKIPATVNALPEGVGGASLTLPDGSRQGKNDFGEIGYGGPQPPSGIHHYHFRVYALDQKLDLKPGASKDELLKMMKGHIIDTGELVGTYKAR